jgi:sugar phosphate isomerase/epimerase
MSDVRLGCQSITWGKDQSEFLPRVFEAIADAGYEGVELGFRHIRPTASSELRRQLDENGLELAATHMGGDLFEASPVDPSRSALEEVLDYLDVAGGARLNYSGLRFHDEAQFERDLQMLREAAARCRDRGVALLYHNHDWELADDGRVMEELNERTELGFCPDIGWMMRGLRSAEAVRPYLDRLGDRVGELHIKDLATVEPAEGINTVMLGEGAAPLEDAVAWAKRAHSGLWVVAEQDKAEGTPEEAVRQNADFLRRAAAKEGV